MELAYTLFFTGLFFGIAAGVFITILLHDNYKRRHPDKFRRN